MATNESMLSTHVIGNGRALAPVAAAEVIDAEFSEAPLPTLRDRLRVLWKHRRVAAVTFVATLVLAALVTALQTRQYTAGTEIQLTSQSPIQLRLEESVVRLDEGDRLVNGASTYLETQVAALQSRDLAERVIRDHHLLDQPAFTAPGRRQPAPPLSANVPSPRGWNPEAIVPASEPMPDDTPVDPAIVDRYLRWLTVRNVRGTDLIDISFTTPSPTLSAFLAAAHTQAYLDTNDEARMAMRATANTFLGHQQLESQARVGEAEAALNRFAAEHPNVAVNQEQQLVVQRIAELSTWLTKAENTRVGLETRYEFLSRPGGNPLPYFADRAGVQRVQLALIELRAQQAALGARLGPNHQQMIAFRDQETELVKQLDHEVANEMAGVRARYDAARLREDSLRQKLGEQESAAIGLRELGARYALLKQDVETAQTLHQSLLKQQVETAVHAQLGASNMRVIERPEVPRRASAPHVRTNLLVGMLAGLLAALAAAFGRELFDSSVKSGDDVATLLSVPTLATIPNLALAERRLAARGARRRRTAVAHDGCAAESVVWRDPRSPIAEAFRALRTAVLYSSTGPGPKVIVVTSASAGEGKTVVSVNLAATLAEAGKRVLLMDADLRRPGCHRALGVSNDVGLSTVLAGGATMDDATLELAAPRLSFVPAGPVPSNPAELVGSVPMRDALEALRDRYDVVILDTPPALPVTDAVILGREADAVALVVKGQDTPRELVKRARDQLVAASAHLLGVVVNNVDLGWDDLALLYGRYAADGIPLADARDDAPREAHA